jgi:hypothetical protein
MIHDANGKHDANAKEPTLPDGWALIGDATSDVEEVDGHFPVLSKKQVGLALLSIGVTSDMVTSAIDKIPDTVKREGVRIHWNDSTSFHRDHPLIAQLSSMIGLDDSAIDEVWHIASTIDD